MGCEVNNDEMVNNDWSTLVEAEERTGTTDELVIDHDNEMRDMELELRPSYADTLRRGLAVENEEDNNDDDDDGVVVAAADATTEDRPRRSRRRRKHRHPRRSTPGSRDPSFFVSSTDPYKVITMLFLTQCDPRVNYDPRQPVSIHDFVGLSLFSGSIVDPSLRRGVILRRRRRFVPPDDYYRQLGRLVYRDKFYNDRNLVGLEHLTLSGQEEDHRVEEEERNTTTTTTTTTRTWPLRCQYTSQSI